MTKYDFYSDKFIQEGWVCPRCGRVNAPWLPNCSCGSNETVVTTDNTSPPSTAWSIYKKPPTYETILTCYTPEIKDIDWSITYGRDCDYESFLDTVYDQMLKDRNEDCDETNV